MEQDPTRLSAHQAASGQGAPWTGFFSSLLEWLRMGKRSPDAPPDVQGPKRGKKPPPTHARIRVRAGKTWREGAAVLTAEELRFNTGRTGRQGEDFFVHIRLDEVRRVTADASTGLMTVATIDGQDVIFELGPLATAWKQLIDERPSLLHRLHVERGARVDLVGVDDDALSASLERGGVAIDAGAVDALFVGAEHRADLARLPSLLPRLRPGGVIWLVVADGTGVSNEEIAAAARSAGLVDGATVELSPGRLAMMLSRRIG